LETEIDYLLRKEREEHNRLTQARKGGDVDLSLNEQYVAYSSELLNILERLKKKL
jgi:hypothetical protein